MIAINHENSIHNVHEIHVHFIMNNYYCQPIFALLRYVQTRVPLRKMSKHVTPFLVSDNCSILLYCDSEKDSVDGFTEMKYCHQASHGNQHSLLLLVEEYTMKFQVCTIRSSYTCVTIVQVERYTKTTSLVCYLWHCYSCCTLVTVSRKETRDVSGIVLS